MFPRLSQKIYGDFSCCLKNKMAQGYLKGKRAFRHSTRAISDCLHLKFCTAIRGNKFVFLFEQKKILSYLLYCFLLSLT